MHAHLSRLQAIFSASAEYYDLVYANKDYQGESDRLRGIFRQFAPHGRTILDIACGTGEHLRLLPEYQVAGIDLEAAFVRIASEKRPDGNFQVADMQRFELGTKFDILICLFSAIGYLLTTEAILSARRGNGCQIRRRTPRVAVARPGPIAGPFSRCRSERRVFARSIRFPWSIRGTERVGSSFRSSNLWRHFTPDYYRSVPWGHRGSMTFRFAE